MTTVQDVQQALKEYRASLSFGGLSKENGQPPELKVLLSGLLSNEEEILALPPETLLTDLSNDYKTNAIAADEIIDQTVYSEDSAGNPIKVNSIFLNLDINEIEFNFSLVIDNLLVFTIDFLKVPETEQQKIIKGIVVDLYDKDDQFLAKGIIRAVDRQKFSVETKDSNLDYSYCKLYKWWSNRESISMWTLEANNYFQDSKLDSFLDVKLYPQAEYLYSCVWSLYYTTPEDVKLKKIIEIAKGIDNIKPGFAYLSRAKQLFKPGVYHLKSRLIKYSNYGSGYNTITWEVAEARRYIRNN